MLRRILLALRVLFTRVLRGEKDTEGTIYRQLYRVGICIQLITELESRHIYT